MSTDQSFYITVTVPDGTGRDETGAALGVALNEDQDATDVTWSDPMIHDLAALPLAVRAPEVGALLARIRDEAEEADGGWPGSDIVSILCEWFTGHGYDVGQADDDEQLEDCLPPSAMPHRTVA